MSSLPEWNAHINHIMACKDCFAPSDKYCPVGRELWLADNVAYVCSLQSKDERRHAIEVGRIMSPGWIDEIMRRVTERYELEKKARQ